MVQILIRCFFACIIASKTLGLEIIDTTPTKVTVSDFDYQRLNPRFPRTPGTANWLLLEADSGSIKFSPRFGHATCIFKCPDESGEDCVWLTGGHSEEYQTFDMSISDRNADVWWSKNGATWNKMMDLVGDYKQGLGNHDAKVPGPVAPWYGRYGHSLDALDADGDGIDDAMVLVGGFDPLPSNEIWISVDGRSWYFDYPAPWPARAYHASAVFKGELWIIGGTPLSNDVWAGRLIRRENKASGYTMSWRLALAPMEAPWRPRAGHCATTQLRRDSYDSDVSNVNYTDYLYIMGGFAGFPIEDERYDNFRCRNDVWVTTNGTVWTRVTPPAGKNTMPWTGRAWHGCITWHDPKDRSLGVNRAAIDDFVSNKQNETVMHPRLYITGGGYTGTKRNHVVRQLDGYLDMWWSYDGSNWQRVNYIEGSGVSQYSTNEWAHSYVDGQQSWKGKWGHTMELLQAKSDLDGDGVISNEPIYVEFSSDGTETAQSTPRLMNAVREDEVPAMLVIGGKATDNGPLGNDVYLTQPGSKWQSIV